MKDFDPNYMEPPELKPKLKLVRTLLTRPLNVDGMLSALVCMLSILAGSLLNWNQVFDISWSVSQADVTSGKWYQLITAVFSHSDWAHFASNAYMLFVLSVLLTSYYKWFLHPILSLSMAVLTNYATIMLYAPETRLIGASGWVYVCAGMWLILFLLVERRYSIRSRLLRVLGVTLVILFPSTFEPNVSYEAHGIGYLLGVAMGIFFYTTQKGRLKSFEEYRVKYEEV